ncbi:unnamed protein product, partial [Amoebophrya sp. A25]
ADEHLPSTSSDGTSALALPIVSRCQAVSGGNLGEQAGHEEANSNRTIADTVDVEVEVLLSNITEEVDGAPVHADGQHDPRLTGVTNNINTTTTPDHSRSPTSRSSLEDEVEEEDNGTDGEDDASRGDRD